MQQPEEDFSKVLSSEIRAVALRCRDEWLIPLPKIREAIGLATQHLIAVLGVEIFRSLREGFVTEGYSGYDLKFRGQWAEFVFHNNEAALQYVATHEFGDGYGYVLTTASAREFKELEEVRNG